MWEMDSDMGRHATKNAPKTLPSGPDAKSPQNGGLHRNRDHCPRRVDMGLAGGSRGPGLVDSIWDAAVGCVARDRQLDHRVMDTAALAPPRNLPAVITRSESAPSSTTSRATDSVVVYSIGSTRVGPSQDTRRAASRKTRSAYLGELMAGCIGDSTRPHAAPLQYYDRAPGESERLTLSNFHALEDRESGEVLVTLPRYFANVPMDGARDFTADLTLIRCGLA